MEGYGKNIYLSKSYFKFIKDKDDFSEREKQKQVLKSLITFTLIKKAKKQNIYHNPLLITLVNSVNTKDADLLLFFKKLEETANGQIEQGLFNETKKEILQEIINNTSYVFGKEKLQFEMSLLNDMSEKDILNQVFNADSYGKVEILEGEKGKEIVLKLETSDKPFALIKIGDTGKFRKEQLGTNYLVVNSFDSKKYFENINSNENINLLIGSRSFYEGWDSNRPNVINMINIGKKDAKKFVLQGIGRGIRIEPHKGERKRLDQNNPNKSSLLETLFVFATDKSAVKAIIQTVESQRNKKEQTIQLFENEEKPFDILIPVYKDIEEKGKIAARFNIAEESLGHFKNYMDCFDSNTLLIKTVISQENLKSLLEGIGSDKVFETKKENVYTDMGLLLQRTIDHIAVKRKKVSGIKEITDEIIHFKHIKVVNFSDFDLNFFNDEIKKVKNYEELNEPDIDDMFDSGKITRQEYKKKIIAITSNKEQGAFKDLIIRKIAQHYYLPLIYSEKEKADYIKHVIKVKTEVNFIKALEKHIKGRTFDFEWMFSKVDESLDSLHIPYFYRKDNIYRKFHPDFIFWIKKGLKYKIVFADPKGTTAAAYQNKADEFEKLFLENSIPKVFKYKDFKITFDLKFIGDRDLVSEKYKEYWDQSFDFLAMP